MMRLIFFPLVLLFISTGFSQTHKVTSPDGRIQVNFTVNKEMTYQVMFNQSVLINTSKLGFKLAEGGDLTTDFELEDIQTLTKDEKWPMIWGEEDSIRNHYNELFVTVKTSSKMIPELNVIFRVFDNGLAFRYEFPAGLKPTDFKIMEEVSEFNFADDLSSWSIPGIITTRYEYLYTNKPLSQVESAHTPFTMTTAKGEYISIHEAALTDYPAMVLEKTSGTHFKSKLIPWMDGVAVYAKTGSTTPWRTIMINDDASGLLTNYMTLNLNEPSKIEDPSWITTGKYIGIWWGMHVDKYTFSSGDRHGATTERTKTYLDFASKHGFKGVLVEGWNEGWDGEWYGGGTVFNFTKPHPDYDIEMVSAYAREKGVSIIGHHETGASMINYENQLEDALDFLNKYEIKMVKSGYVGDRPDNKEYAHGQYAVRHYRLVVERMAAHQIMLNVHEPIKDTGIRRTWPNMMTREGARGQEYNAWSGDGGNPPNHTTIIPFTRLLCSPMDFTPGIFNLTLKGYNKPNNRVMTTLAKQLALYVVIYSPWQMAADLIENYENQPAFQFIKDVATDWQQSKVPFAEIGEHVTFIRQAKGSEEWFLGSITNEKARTLSLNLDFLDPGKTYTAHIYADAAEADWKTNPYAIDIKTMNVTSETKYEIKLAPGGGQAIRFVPKK